MTTTLTAESKNSLFVTNETKTSGITWDDANFSWEDAEGTWDDVGLVVSKESKNSTSLSNETKN